MRVVLHDWPDNKTVEILKRVRSAIGERNLLPLLTWLQLLG